MKTTTHFVLAATLLLGVASCDSSEKDPQPEAPAPPATFMLSRSEYFPASSESAGISYPSQDIKAAAALTVEQLRMSFGTEKGLDAISFIVDKSRLKPGFVGTYTLKSQPDVKVGDAEVTYTYYMRRSPSGSAASLYFSTTARMQGQFVVTSYDERRHLASGQYELRLDNIPDPADSRLDDTDKRRCNLKVEGSFENLPVTQ